MRYANIYECPANINILFIIYVLTFIRTWFFRL